MDLSIGIQTETEERPMQTKTIMILLFTAIPAIQTIITAFGLSFIPILHLCGCVRQSPGI